MAHMNMIDYLEILSQSFTNEHERNSNVLKFLYVKEIVEESHSE